MFADVNGDGRPDLYLTNNFQDTGVRADYLFMNQNASLFTEEAQSRGIDDLDGGSHGATWADLDNDGDLDLVFAGDDEVFVNQGDGIFVAGPSLPTAGINDPRAIAFVDIDNDGDLDFAVAAKRSRNWLLRNDFNSGNWLKVKLVSPSGQAGAFGAKVWVRPAGDAITLIGMREAKGNHGYLAQDDPVLHFGLGSRTLVDVFVDYVECPNSTARFEWLAVDVTIDPLIEISGDVCPLPPP